MVFWSPKWPTNCQHTTISSTTTSTTTIITKNSLDSSPITKPSDNEQVSIFDMYGFWLNDEKCDLCGPKTESKSPKWSCFRYLKQQLKLILRLFGFTWSRKFHFNCDFVFYLVFKFDHFVEAIDFLMKKSFFRQPSNI